MADRDARQRAIEHASRIVRSGRSPFTSRTFGGPLIVWYCRGCRRVLKAEPKWALPRGCECLVPVLPPGPTKVWDA